MAYRRSIIARTKLFYFYQQQQRLSPSFSHISNSDREELHTNSNSEICSYIHNPFLITRDNSSNSQLLSRNVFQLRPDPRLGRVFHRNLSSAHGGEREVLNGVVGEVAEVAIAAADSFPPVAALQYLVDYVHCYTGFNWWASIAVTTILLRFIQYPFIIYHLKFFSKYYATLVQPQLLAAMTALRNSNDSNGLEKAVAIVPKLVNEYGKINVMGHLISEVMMFSFSWPF